VSTVNGLRAVGEPFLQVWTWHSECALPINIGHVTDNATKVTYRLMSNTSEAMVILRPGYIKQINLSHWIPGSNMQTPVKRMVHQRSLKYATLVASPLGVQVNEGSVGKQLHQVRFHSTWELGWQQLLLETLFSGLRGPCPSRISIMSWVNL
jgi:hypothetical protein